MDSKDTSKEENKKIIPSEESDISVKKKPPVVAAESSAVIDEDDEALYDEDEDEDLLVENDGDFFWLLQRAIWTIVKILFSFGALFLIVWVIWSDDEEVSVQETEQQAESVQENTPSVDPVQTQTAKKQLPVEKATPVSSEPSPAFQNRAVQDALQEEIILRDDIGVYMQWNKRVKTFFETRMDVTRWGESPEVRSQSLDKFLDDIYTFVTESIHLRRQLVQKLNGYYNGITHNTELIEYHTLRLNEALSLVRPDEVEFHVYKKIAFQKQREQNTVFYDTNKYALQMMEMYDKALRDVYYKAQANKRALIYNIQVVQFQDDPFARVLTPAQWQSR